MRLVLLALISLTFAGCAALRDDFPGGVDQAHRNFGPAYIDPHHE